MSVPEDARLFLGLELNDEARRALLGVRRTLEEGGIRARMHHSSLYHLTLVFLGSTPRASIPRLREVMDGVAAQPFSLALSGLGTFKNGSVLWAGVAPCPALTDYQARLRLALERAGFPSEDMPYRPHITLGRQVKGPLPAAPVPAVSFRAEGATLFESARVEDRLAYLPLYRSEFR